MTGVHHWGGFVEGASPDIVYVACPRCRRLLTGEEFMRVDCGRKGMETNHERLGGARVVSDGNPRVGRDSAVSGGAMIPMGYAATCGEGILVFDMRYYRRCPCCDSEVFVLLQPIASPEDTP